MTRLSSPTILTTYPDTPTRVSSVVSFPAKNPCIQGSGLVPCLPCIEGLQPRPRIAKRRRHRPGKQNSTPKRILASVHDTSCEAQMGMGGAERRRPSQSRIVRRGLRLLPMVGDLRYELCATRQRPASRALSASRAISGLHALSVSGTDVSPVAAPDVLDVRKFDQDQLNLAQVKLDAEGVGLRVNHL